MLGRTGLDLIKGVVRNNIEAGVIEPAMSKVKIIQVNRLHSSMTSKLFLLEASSYYTFVDYGYSYGTAEYIESTLCKFICLSLH